jgi:2-C-methyl-D-erythritol 2,4-cyclodiphosphate synthase
MNRVGIGIDVHQFAAGRKCIIGGVDIADALLGAAALGDIGKYYPPSDNQFKNMDSMVIVRECAERVRQAGGSINNIDAMIIAQAPKMAPHIPKMQEILARHLDVAPCQVGIKATTSEHLGFTGRKEGIVVVAIASVEM